MKCIKVLKRSGSGVLELLVYQSDLVPQIGDGICIGLDYSYTVVDRVIYAECGDMAVDVVLYVN